MTGFTLWAEQVRSQYLDLKLRLKPHRMTAYRVAAQPEAWSAINCLIWAGWVFFRPAESNVQQLYEILNRLLSNPQWVVLAIAIGVFQGAAVIRNGRYARATMALIAGVFWGVLAHGLYLGNPSAPGAAVYLGDALLNIVLCTMLLCPRR